MEKIYRQVSVKDRLPEKDGIVVCISSDGQPFITLYDVGISISSSAAYWLEEVELPSEENVNNSLINSKRHITTYSLYQNGYEDGANYILNTLKGEKR